MNNKAILILKIEKRDFTTDLEIPLDISANELVIALNAAYELGINTADVKDCYLKAENPIVLLKGNRSLYDYGVHNGTVINITE